MLRTPFLIQDAERQEKARWLSAGSPSGPWWLMHVHSDWTQELSQSRLSDLGEHPKALAYGFVRFLEPSLVGFPSLLAGRSTDRLQQAADLILRGPCIGGNGRGPHFLSL